MHFVDRLAFNLFNKHARSADQMLTTHAVELKSDLRLFDSAMLFTIKQRLFHSEARDHIPN